MVALVVALMMQLNDKHCTARIHLEIVTRGGKVRVDEKSRGENVKNNTGIV